MGLKKAIKEIIKKGKKRCRGCNNLRGICIIKATEREYTCPCLVCPVIVMCKIACEPFEKQTEYAHRIFNFEKELRSGNVYNQRKNT